MKTLCCHPLAPALALVAFFAPGPARPGDLAARLVRDIDSTSYGGSSHPRGFFPAYHGFGFLAFGREMWLRIDDGGEFVYRGLSGRSIREIGSHPYFILEEAPGRTSLWRLDSGFSLSRLREAPFRRIGQAWEGSTGLLFEGDEGGGPGLWSAESGRWVPPREIARPLPFEDGSLARSPQPYFGRDAFIARDRGMGTALWRTDGTPSGTFPVFAPPGGFESILGVFGGRLLLAAAGGGPELWTSDLTAAGTQPLIEIIPGRRAARIVSVTEGSDRLFLILDEGARGRELWVSDGTGKGTQRLTRFAPSDPFGPTPLSETSPLLSLLFFADDGIHGREPWWTDGTLAGTRILADLCPGSCASRGELLTGPLNERATEVLFSGWTPEQGLELWQTDGNPEETRLFTETCPGPCDGDPRGVVKRIEGEHPFSVRFTGRDAAGERALWTAHNVGPNPLRLTPPGVEVFDVDRPFGYFGYEYFAAGDVESGEEVWTTDGTPEGTRLWKDIELERDNGSTPYALGVVKGRFLFSAFDPDHRRQLWSSDGTGDGTVRIPGFDLRSGWNLARLETVGGVGFLIASTSETNFGAVWATDGTAAGTRRLTPEGVEAITFLGIHAAGSRALFFAQDSEHGLTIWTSDGTPEDTRLAVDPAPGPRSMVVEDAVSGKGFLRDRVLFRRRADAGRLWVTDGTPGGTKRLAEEFPFFFPSQEPLFVGHTAEVDGRLFYVGSDGLWVTDGTPEGTRLVWILGPGKRIDQLFAARSKVYFEATIDDPETGNEEEAYWLTEGIPGDARRVGTAFSSGGFLEAATYGDRLLFSDETGRLTVTDGTDCGTVSLRFPNGEPAFRDAAGAVEFTGRFLLPAEEGADETCQTWDGIGDTLTVLPGPVCRYFFRPNGSKLFFGGFEPRTGLELWVLEALRARL